MDIILAGTAGSTDYDLIILSIFLFWLLVSIVLYSISKIRRMREEALHPEDHDIELEESEHRIFGRHESMHPTI